MATDGIWTFRNLYTDNKDIYTLVQINFRTFVNVMTKAETPAYEIQTRLKFRGLRYSDDRRSIKLIFFCMLK